jgi:small subunit ribosomal protein S13
MTEEKQEKQSKPRSDISSGASSIVRIVGKDVDGSLSVERALDQVKGIGSNMAHALSYEIESKLGIDRHTQFGSLSEEQVAGIERIIKDPAGSGIPSYFLNRNKDHDNGTTMYLAGNDLVFAVRQDINKDVNSRTWRGFRHQYGQRVRGQHTRSTGRTGVTVGVTKKAVKLAQAAALQSSGKGATPEAKAGVKGAATAPAAPGKPAASAAKAAAPKK